MCLCLPDHWELVWRILEAGSEQPSSFYSINVTLLATLHVSPFNFEKVDCVLVHIAAL